LKTLEAKPDGERWDKEREEWTAERKQLGPWKVRCHYKKLK